MRITNGFLIIALLCTVGQASTCMAADVPMLAQYPKVLEIKPDYADAQEHHDKALYAQNAGNTLAGSAEPNTATGENILTNPGAEAGNNAPEAWQQGAAIPGVKYSWDRKVGIRSKSSLCIEKTANQYFPIAQWSQTVDRKGNAHVLEVSAQVKAEKVTKAMLDVLFLDKDGQWISHKWVAYIGSKKAGQPPANHDWKKYFGKVNIPPGTAKLCIGLQVYGPGKVWFDDVCARYATGK